MNELVTKIRVHNEDFFVASTIERCPKSMMLRELVKNALEAAASAPLGERQVEIAACRVDGVRKLRIWNTGVGMNAEELFRMCDIASSIGKMQGLDGNFGMGAKVASLPSNHHGVRYRSCREGRVSEVLLGKRSGVYGRVLRPDPVTGAPSAVLDVTDQVKAEGLGTGSDWTEVVLLGNRASQDTVADPYDGNPKVPKWWLQLALQQRFFQIRGDVDVLLGPDLHDLSGMRPFIPFLRIVGESFARWDTVQVADGVKVHFGYDPVHLERAEVNASYKDSFSRGVSFAGLLHGDELYEVRMWSGWTGEAPNYGISSDARHLSVLVELDEDYPVRAEGYRQFLRYKNGAQDQVRMMDFAAMVRANHPAWLRDMMRSASPDQALIGSVRQQLEKLIASLGLKRLRPKFRSPPPVPKPPAPASDKTKEPPVPASVQPPAPPKPAAEAKPTPPKPPEAKAKEPPEKKDSPEKVEDFEEMPELLLLRSAQEVADRNLQHRAARFYPESHQLYVNLRYPSAQQMAELLIASAPPEVAPALARGAAQAAAENALVLRLGRALVYGLAKRNATEGWSEAEQKQVLSSEVLTLIADDLHLAFPAAKEFFDTRIERAVKDAADSRRAVVEMIAS
ncbi:ATP-binding protein [Xanthobacter sp. DSM 24535]|uniref:ATP-binding protein n=1 Tax=Roseixanthobacter psychrophilus TaxID=3119917 RepID=UPI003726F2B9